MKLEYTFQMDREVILEIQEILKKGRYQADFLTEMDKIEEESQYRPYRDFHWEISRLISKYYSLDMLTIDSNFKMLNDFLMHKWHEEMPDELRQEMVKNTMDLDKRG